MVKRILDANRSDFLKMNSKDLNDSIRSANGRTVCAEIECDRSSLIDGVSNLEIVASMGADILVLANFDVNEPYIDEIPQDLLKNQPIFTNLKEFVGRPIGVNLLVEDHHNEKTHTCQVFNMDNVERLVSEGVDIIFLIKQQSTGATIDSVNRAVQSIHKKFNDKVMIVCSTETKDKPPRDKQILQEYLDAHKNNLFKPWSGRQN